MKTEGFALGFQPSRGTLRMLMNDKIMFDRYYCIKSAGAGQLVLLPTRTLVNSYPKTRTLLFPGQLVLYAFGQLVLFNWSTRTF